LKAIATHCAAEAHYRGLANVSFLRKIDNAHMNHFFAVCQNIVRHLALRSAHFLMTGFNGADDISGSQITVHRLAVIDISHFIVTQDADIGL
jgi:hypothetical protein